MVGATGSGKTLLARTFAKMLQVPFTIVDATVLTEAGYVGEDIESILTRLLLVDDYNVNARKEGSFLLMKSIRLPLATTLLFTRDVSGEGVQQGIIKSTRRLGGECAAQGGRKHPEQRMIAVIPKYIVHCGGAFDG
jgi:ATP-dependent Clp protease ATP-binding subunit ClpX